MKKFLPLLFAFLLAAVLAPAPNAAAAHDAAQSAGYTGLRFEDLKWQPIVPELGKASPLIAIAHVDPKSQATQLFIRTPMAIHVPAHWHHANESHTLLRGTAVFEHDGQYQRLAANGFNYVPAKMPHQAWLSAGSLTFITVDGAWDVSWVKGPPTKADVNQKPPK